MGILERFWQHAWKIFDLAHSTHFVSMLWETYAPVVAMVAINGTGQKQGQWHLALCIGRVYVCKCFHDKSIITLTYFYNYKGEFCNNCKIVEKFIIELICYILYTFTLFYSSYFMLFLLHCDLFCLGLIVVIWSI